MSDTPQNLTTKTGGVRKLAFTCGTYSLVAGLSLSLLAIVAAALILMDILP